MTTKLDIKTVAPSEQPHAVDGCVEAITRAFANDPAARFLWPGDDEYNAWFPGFVRAFGGAAFEGGSAYYIDDYAGSALWLPPGAHPDDEALDALLQKSVPAADLAGMSAIFEQMGAYHPNEAHWHLPLVGVRPEHQGKGYGTALMAPALARCDREGTLAYLEATTPLNARLYERLGFEPLGAIPCGTTIIVPMVRRPR